MIDDEYWCDIHECEKDIDRRCIECKDDEADRQYDSRLDERGREK